MMSSLQIEEPCCPLCGGHHFWCVSFADPQSQRIVKRNTGYYWKLCKICGNAFPSEAPDRKGLQQYWEQNRVDESERSIDDAVWRRRMFESRIWGERTYNFLSPHCLPGQNKILDIACGLGGTVAVFQENGWQAEGLDPDPNTKAFHEKLGLSTRIGRVEELELPQGLDVICIAHAIYFIENPLGFLRRVKLHLATNSYFVVVLSHLFSSINSGRPGFAHTWYPTRKSLEYIMAAEGFERVDFQSMKGSDLLLFKIGKPKILPSPAMEALFLHRTQLLRYRIFGTMFHLAKSAVRTFTNSRLRK